MPSGGHPATGTVEAYSMGRPASTRGIGMSLTATKRAPIGTKARTGEICPESGVWKVEGSPSTTAPIAKGNRMPPHDGKAVTWVLIQYA
jgi:hypothetical protein